MSKKTDPKLAKLFPEGLESGSEISAGMARSIYGKVYRYLRDEKIRKTGDAEAVPSSTLSVKEVQKLARKGLGFTLTEKQVKDINAGQTSEKKSIRIKKSTTPELKRKFEKGKATIEKARGRAKEELKEKDRQVREDSTDIREMKETLVELRGEFRRAETRQEKKSIRLREELIQNEIEKQQKSLSKKVVVGSDIDERRLASSKDRGITAKNPEERERQRNYAKQAELQERQLLIDKSLIPTKDSMGQVVGSISIGDYAKKVSDIGARYEKRSGVSLGRIEQFGVKLSAAKEFESPAVVAQGVNVGGQIHAAAVGGGGAASPANVGVSQAAVAAAPKSKRTPKQIKESRDKQIIKRLKELRREGLDFNQIEPLMNAEFGESWNDTTDDEADD